MASKNDKYRYFDRDISWLAFNKRVLVESLDKSVPVYERINFLSIFSSNLEEFYQVRVASEKGDLQRAIGRGDREEARKKEDTLNQLTEEVKRQEELFRSAWEDVMVQDLYDSGLEMITDYRDFEGEIKAFVDKFFMEEIFPFLQPVLINPSLVRVFVRDKRIYLCVHLRRLSDGAIRLYMIKLPFTKAPRFLSLPSRDGILQNGA